MDESNVLDSSFLERMNTLLANGEVPGLFEGDELTTLMTQCQAGAQREGLMLDSQEELYKWFTQQVSTGRLVSGSPILIALWSISDLSLYRRSSVVCYLLVLVIIKHCLATLHECQIKQMPRRS